MTWHVIMHKTISEYYLWQRIEITKYQTIKHGKICYIYRIKAHQWINWSEGILGEEIIMAMLHKSA